MFEMVLVLLKMELCVSLSVVLPGQILVRDSFGSSYYVDVGTSFDSASPE